MRELAAPAELRTAHREDPLVSLLIEAATLHTKARLQLADQADEQAGRLTEAAGSEREESSEQAFKANTRASSQ